VEVNGLRYHLFSIEHCTPCQRQLWNHYIDCSDLWVVALDVGGERCCCWIGFDSDILLLDEEPYLE
jgi:hypothetical protein